jgi:hypothetical protein
MASVILRGLLAAISVIPFSALIRHAQDKSILGRLGNSASRLGNLLGVCFGALIQAQTNFHISFIAIGLVYMALAILAKLYAKPFHSLALLL